MNERLILRQVDKSGVPTEEKGVLEKEKRTNFFYIPSS